jgi:uncharacterized protein (TIGR02001 family)
MLCAGLSLFLPAGPAAAQDASVAKQPARPEVPAASAPVDVIYGARYQTDYRFRGVSQSNRAGSGQTYFELQLFDNVLYGGFASYKVDLPTRPGAELDITAGIRPKFGPFTFDLGFVYYLYPAEKQLLDLAGAPLTVRNTDFIEFAGKVAYAPNEELTLGAGVFHTSNFLGTHANATFVNGTFKYAFPEGSFGFLPAGFALSAEFGHYFLGQTHFTSLGNVKLPDYNTGNVGISYTYKELTLDLRFHDTDLSKKQCFVFTGDPRGIATGSGRSNWCGDAVVATLSVDFTGSKGFGIFGD